MTPKDRIAIGNFLDTLQSTSKGCALVVNMHDSCAQSLVSPDTLSEFLLDCVETSKAAPAKDAVSIVEDVSCGYGSARKIYLRQCKQKHTFNRMKRVSNTINAVNFHSFLLDEKYKAGSVNLLPIVLPKVPTNTPSGIREYQTRLSEVTANPTWKKPSATIGRPLPTPSNCWISADHLNEGTKIPKYPHNPATEARDKLGLIDCRDGEFLLRLSFLTSSLGRIHGNELARPVFSDLGNSRFRVHQTSKHAVKFAKQGWGATIHLGKFGNKKFRNLTGARERVSSALPLAELDGLTVEFLGRVTENRGIESHDNDEVYANELQAGQTAINIKNKLLSLLK